MSNPIKLNLDNRLFNKLFFQIKDESQDKKILIIYGGSGAGKSHTICQHELYKALTVPGIRILFLTKTLPQAKISTVPLVEKILKSWKIYSKVKYNKSDLTWTFPNGSVIIVKDLFDSERLKGIVIDRIWCEEASEITRDEALELIRRLRGADLKSPQLLFSFNPISVEHWLKSTFVDKESVDDRIKVIKVTYKDNKFLSESNRKDLELLKDYDYQQYCVYALGEWGMIKKGTEIYTHFRGDKHIDSSIEYDSNKPLILSFDENSAPYLTCLIAQNDGNTVNFIDELCIRQAQLDVVLDEFERRYYNHKAGVIITGDATSNKKNVYGDSFYQLIRTRLQKFNPETRLNTINQSVFTRTNWINTEVFRNEVIKVRIHPSCTETIRDLDNVKRLADNTKDKKMISKDGMRYQEYGHASDCVEAVLTTLYLSEFHQYQTGGVFRMIQKSRPGVGFRY